MKKLRILSIVAALLCATSVFAQQNFTSYFMEGSTFRSQLNPALAPNRGYINIPALGGIQLGLTGNVTLDKFLFPRDGKLVTIFDNSVTADEALSGLKSINSLSVNSRINVLGFGAYTSNGRNFWSFDLNARMNVDTSFPYSLFEFLKLGNDAQIGGIAMQADAYVEAAFSYSFAVDRAKRLYIGVRPKVLMGIARARLAYDKFDVTLDEDRWTVDAGGVLDITAADIEVTNTDRYFRPGDLDMKPTKPVGLGFAIDLGATYQILPNLQASFAVNDLGFIKWKKKDNLTAMSNKTLNFEGIEIDGMGQQGEQPDFDLNVFEFERAESVDNTVALNASIVAGLDYEILNHKLSFGMLYTANIREYETLHNLTASVNFQPKRWVTLSGSYSFLDNRGNAFGLGVNFNPGAINFYLATDMLLAKKTKQWVPIKQSYMNFTFGVGVPIGKWGKRVKDFMSSEELSKTCEDARRNRLTDEERERIEEHRERMEEKLDA